MFHIKHRYLYILLLGVYSFFNIKFTGGDELINLSINDAAIASVIIFLTLLVWEGNHGIGYALSSKPYKKLSYRLISHFLVSIVMVVILSLSTSIFLAKLFNDTSYFGNINQLLGFLFRINLFLHCINAIVTYNRALSKSRLEAEILKNENKEAQFEALRKQVNPHFLFNSFNILTSIIENDSKLAVTFVDQLSNVYRYLLKTESQKLVPLKEELEFIESYLFLLTIRFRDNISVTIDVSGEGHVPPATLQLLLENAIKHNEVSKKYPLTISIKQSNGLISVSNNKNPKENTMEPSHIGLANLEHRYQLLAKKSIDVRDSSTEFRVTVPVLNELP